MLDDLAEAIRRWTGKKKLAPVMPTVLPVQLLPAARKIHSDDLGIIENKPPSQLSLIAIQLLQQIPPHMLFPL